jgi:NAD(P)-dependent dehydrogenase (short-subunit alcohol dehydrogenase family)
MDLMGKVAVITGGAGGMGGATANRLAGLGATVIGVDVADERGRALFDGLGAPHRYRHLDVSDSDAWEALIKEVVADFGGIDIIHLNAGAMLRPPDVPLMTDPLPWLTAQAYRRVMGVNADGVVFGLIASLPHLQARGGGDIIVTSSVNGIAQLNPDPAYAASKFGLIGLVLSLAPTLEPLGVRLNAVCPGAVDTHLVPPDMREIDGVHFSPSSFIADVVVQVLESSRTGEIWVAMSDQPGGVWQHHFAPIVDPDGRVYVKVGASSKATFERRGC